MNADENACRGMYRQIHVMDNPKHLLRSLFTASYKSILQPKFREFSSFLLKAKKASLGLYFSSLFIKYLLSASYLSLQYARTKTESARKFLWSLFANTNFPPPKELTFLALRGAAKLFRSTSFTNTVDKYPQIFFFLSLHRITESEMSKTAMVFFTNKSFSLEIIA